MQVYNNDEYRQVFVSSCHQLSSDKNIRIIGRLENNEKKQHDRERIQHLKVNNFNDMEELGYVKNYFLNNTTLSKTTAQCTAQEP